MDNYQEVIEIKPERLKLNCRSHQIDKVYTEKSY